MSENPTGQGAIPVPDLRYVISTFGMQAFIACGVVENPVTNKREADLAVAQFHIGILEAIEAKTKGNLTEEEARMLEETLHHARIAYLHASSNPAAEPEKAAEEPPASS